MTCDHVTKTAISDWFNQAITVNKCTVAGRLTQKEVANHNKDNIEFHWFIN